jgi:hypothetical protein
VIGLGEAGLRVLQRLRFDLGERYGPPEMLPVIRTLYVDTDPETLDAASRTRPTERLAALDSDDVFAAKLNRAAHYMKPRLSGRTLTEGWFEPQLLYRIPRAPQTMGVRMFGRLAFCDYYRPLMGKVHATLDAAVAADAMTQTETWTGLLRRTNRPRVYVVTSLGGGTGSGMFLDVAYAVRHRLKRMGYESPEVIGVLVVPPADPFATSPQSLGNTYAALTELNYYSRAETTFTAQYDERHGVLREKEPPFARCYLIPGTATGPDAAVKSPQRTPPSRTPPTIAKPGSRTIAPPGSRTIALPGSRTIAPPGSRVLPASSAQRRTDPLTLPGALKPYTEAADLIRLNLFSPLGRCIDDARTALDATRGPQPGTLTAFGLTGFGWPRAEVVARTAQKVAKVVLRRWATPDVRRMREVIPGLAQAKWTELGLAPESVLAHLQKVADQAAGKQIDDLISATVEPLMPRGWLARLPEPETVNVAVDRLVKLLGAPGAAGRRGGSAIDKALAEAAAETGGGCGLDIHALVPTLVDDPQFRLAGAEDMLRQFHTTCERLIDRHLLSAGELDVKAKAAFDSVVQYAHFKKGMRKPVAAEFAEALRQYPRARFDALAHHHVARVYHAVREVLTAQLAEVTAARQRLETANQSNPRIEPPEIPVGIRQLLPPGCIGMADAVEGILKAVTDADLNEIDRRVQMSIEPNYGTVFQACLNSMTGSEDVLTAVYEETRAHLDARLGAVNLAGMFTERYRTPQQAERAIQETFQEAEPTWIESGPWAGREVAVLGCPAGSGGEPLRELARRAIPVAGLPIVETPDDLTVYREWPGIPLAALPQVGPASAAAYRVTNEAQQCTPHARLDVTTWTDAAAP